MVTHYSCGTMKSYCAGDGSPISFVARYGAGQSRPWQGREGPMVREIQLLAVGLVFAFLGAIVVGVL